MQAFRGAFIRLGSIIMWGLVVRKEKKRSLCFIDEIEGADRELISLSIFQILLGLPLCVHTAGNCAEVVVLIVGLAVKASDGYALHPMSPGAFFGCSIGTVP